MVTNVGAATPRAIISAKSTPDFSLKTEHNMAAEMSLTLTEEHEMIRQAARDFAQKEIAPVAAEYDVSGEFPFATIEKMGALGLMGIEVPEE